MVLIERWAAILKAKIKMAVCAAEAGFFATALALFPEGSRVSNDVDLDSFSFSLVGIHPFLGKPEHILPVFPTKNDCDHENSKKEDRKPSKNRDHSNLFPQKAHFRRQSVSVHCHSAGWPELKIAPICFWQPAHQYSTWLRKKQMIALSIDFLPLLFRPPDRENLVPKDFGHDAAVEAN